MKSIKKSTEHSVNDTNGKNEASKLYKHFPPEKVKAILQKANELKSVSNPQNVHYDIALNYAKVHGLLPYDQDSQDHESPQEKLEALQNSLKSDVEFDVELARGLVAIGFKHDIQTKIEKELKKLCEKYPGDRRFKVNLAHILASIIRYYEEDDERMAELKKLATHPEDKEIVIIYFKTLLNGFNHIYDDDDPVIEDAMEEIRSVAYDFPTQADHAVAYAKGMHSIIQGDYGNPAGFELGKVLKELAGKFNAEDKIAALYTDCLARLSHAVDDEATSEELLNELKRIINAYPDNDVVAKMYLEGIWRLMGKNVPETYSAITSLCGPTVSRFQSNYGVVREYFLILRSLFFQTGTCDREKIISEMKELADQHADNRDRFVCDTFENLSR